MRHPRAIRPDITADDPLQAWREEAVTHVARLLVLIVIPLLVVDALYNFQLGRWRVMLVDCSACVCILGLAAARGLSYRLRALAIVGLCLAGGAAALLSFGLYGVAPLPMITGILLAALLLGPRSVLAVGLAWGAVMAGIFVGFALGAIPYPYEPGLQAAEASRLINNWLLLMGMVTLLTLIIGSLISRLETSLRATRGALADLERLNASLDATVERRTAELRRAAALLEATQRAARVGGVAFDRDGLSLEWTPEAYRIHEVPPGTRLDCALLGRLYPGDAWEGFVRMVQQLGADSEPYELEFAALTLSGRPLWVRARGLAEPGDGPARYIGALQDITAHKEAELALAASEGKYRTLFALLPAGVTLADTDGKIVEVNPAAQSMLGISTEDHLARRIDDPRWDIIQSDGTPFPADSLPSVRAPRERQIIANVEMGVARPSGGRTWLSVNAAPLSHATYGVAITYIDITGRKQAELALSEQLRYAEALAHCSQALLVHGVIGDDWTATIKQALAALRSAIGCRRLSLNLYQSPDEILTLPSISIVDQAPDVPPHQEVAISFAELPVAAIEAIGGGGWIAGTPEELFPDSTPARQECELNGVRSLLIAGFHVAGLWRGHLAASDGSRALEWGEPIIGLLRTGLDMIAASFHQAETTTMLRTREALLYAAQTRQDALLKAIPDLLLGVDGDMNVRFAHVPSPSPLALPAGAIGQPLGRVVPPAVARAVSAARARPDVDPPAFIATFSPPDAAEERAVESRAVIMGDGEALLIVRDITARQRIQDDLERARDAAEAATRAKSAFLASMSHEIRTPLNAVIGMAAMLKDTELTSDQRVFVDTIDTGGQALLAVISDILDFSRIESGRLELDAAPFDLHACLASTVDLVGHAARQKGVAVRRAFSPELPQAVLGDLGRLRQVLLNLLGNAVKFTDRGEVSLYAAAATTGEGATWLTIAVRDTGIGIAPEQVERIFEPFAQADSTMFRRHGGAGLGLAISRQLVALMGGSLNVVSAPGAGSTFTVSLPLQLAPIEALARPAEPAVAAVGPLRVLVAEDNPINQAVIGRMLSWLGHGVTIVADGLSAVRAVTEGAYNVVLMDVQMPELDGEEAARRIRGLGAAIAQPHIIALTANALGGDRERALRAGMDDYLSKPVQPADLQQALARVAGDGAARARGPAASDAPSAEALIEADVIDRMIASFRLDRAETISMIKRMLEETLPPQIEIVEAAAAAGDAPRLRSAAHHLRGGCLQLGALAMAALCQRIEHDPGEQAPAALVEQLRPCYARTRALLYERYP